MALNVGEEHESVGERSGEKGEFARAWIKGKLPEWKIELTIRQGFEFTCALSLSLVASWMWSARILLAVSSFYNQ
jgi:hypothetical protein